MSEIAEFAGVAPEWLVVVAVVLVILNFVGRTLAEASESWAKVLGPPGRWWRRRGLRRRQERVVEREARAADLEDMTRQLDYVSLQLESCRVEHEPKDAYIEYDARWHRETSLKAIEAGCEMPAHLSYRQWRAQSS